MSTKLAQLESELKALPKTGNSIEDTMVSLLQTSAMMIPILFTADGDRNSMRSSYDSLEKTAGSATRTLGASHPANVLMKKMLLCARAIMEGKPEPSDAELARMAYGGGAGSKPATAASSSDAAPQAKKGCALLLAILLGSAAMISVAVAGWL